jgi:hypothetical protein
MNFKWLIVLFISSLFLQACAEEQELNTFIVESPLLEMADIEEDYFWVSNPGLPNYALVKSPMISAIDFLEEGHVLEFDFINPEKIKGVLIDVESKMEISLQVGEYEEYFNLDKGINKLKFNVDQVTDTVLLTAISVKNKKAKVKDVLFETFEKVEEQVYQSFIEKEAGIIDFTQAVDWSSDPEDNLNYMDEFLKEFPFSYWHYYVRVIDFNQLLETPEKWIGHPVLICGPIESVDSEMDLNRVVVKNGLLEVPVIIYFDEKIKNEDLMNTVAVFLGFDEGLIFYSQSYSLDR